MFVTFFQELKQAGVPVTLREYLTLMDAMEADLASRRVEDFYYLSRAALVKDERNLDKFDRVFGHVFKGLELMSDAPSAEIPSEWLKKLAEKYLTEEEKKQIEAMGGLDKLLETLRQRMREQKGRHQGGKKWIGTAGTSPFGAYGYNPEGIRIGQYENRNFRAVKVWDRREFKDLDDQVELGTRNIKIALRRLRKFARTGAPEELDLAIGQPARDVAGPVETALRGERVADEALARELGAVDVAARDRRAAEVQLAWQSGRAGHEVRVEHVRDDASERAPDRRARTRHGRTAREARREHRRLRRARVMCARWTCRPVHPFSTCRYRPTSANVSVIGFVLSPASSRNRSMVARALSLSMSPIR